MTKHSNKQSPNKLLAVVSRPISPIALIVSVLALVFVFSLLLNLKFMISGTNSPITRTLLQNFDEWQHPTLSPDVCKYHDNPPKSTYLASYTVSRGDTLLSIAKDKLGDPSRVNELINFNKDVYPSLSMDTPFLEVGWKLYLPPFDFPKSSGKTSEVRGRIVDLNSVYWDVQSDDYQGAAPSRFYYISVAKFKNKGQKEYRVGDCVNVFLDLLSGVGQPILVTPQ